jgi:hypothetical protein
MCHDNVPFTVTSTLSYGFAASPAAGNQCGLCYRLTFDGTGKYDAGNPPKAGTASLKGKEMIVQATNIGHDVAKQQYDISIPGGGVGIFDACTAQWGVASAADLGAQYGGFLTTCQKTLGYDAHDALKTCVSDKCTAIFGTKFPSLYKGMLTKTCGWQLNAGVATGGVCRASRLTFAHSFVTHIHSLTHSLTDPHPHPHAST